MLDLDTRATILRLRDERHGIRAIARILNISRATVKKVITQGVKEVPRRAPASEEKLDRDQVAFLYASCEGNLVRVHEELETAHVRIPYSTLTGFCRREKIGVKEKKRKGQYHFNPGQEMQHDTSPHDVVIGGKKRRVQCASLVLAYSRMLYAQVYPTFNRFYCKNFLSQGVQYFRGAAEFCMVDNTNVVRASGTGKSMIPTTEMAAFSERFNFRFIAHEIGDANRSARVENPFYYIENNFYKGRTFADLADLNNQLAQWCKKIALKPLGTQAFSRMDLYQSERLHLQKLPVHIPEIYALHSRIVNLEGNVQLHRNRYSVPDELLGRRVEIRESIDKIRVFDGHKLVAEHPRSHEGAGTTVATASHRTEGRRPLKGKYGSDRILPEEKTLRAAAPEIDAMVAAIRKEGRSRTSPAIKRLYRLYLDYPTDALCKACERALEYGLTDLPRIERMVLRNVAGDYFPLNIISNSEDIEHE